MGAGAGGAASGWIAYAQRIARAGVYGEGVELAADVMETPLPAVMALPEGVVALVLMPARNRKDLHEIPEATRSALQFVWLETVEGATRATLGTGSALQQRPRFELM